MLFSFIPKRGSRYCGFRGCLLFVSCGRLYSAIGKPLVTATLHLGAQRTIEGTVTTERAARCAAARTPFAQYWQPYRSRTLSHLRRVVFQATVVGALSFGLEVACLTDVDVRVVHGCFVPLFYKFSGRDAYRFEHGRNLRQNQCREGDATGSIVVLSF